MPAMPCTRTLFANDVIGSSSNDDDLLDDIRPTVERLLNTAFHEAGIDYFDRSNVSDAGDGDLMSFPETFLPSIVDVGYHLHPLLFTHNRRNRPAVPMRIALHSAPMVATDDPTFQRPYIELSRMLNAQSFKDVVARVRETRPFTLAVIMSEPVYRTAVLARRTNKVFPDLCAELNMKDAEGAPSRCWLYLPGVERATLTELQSSTETPQSRDASADAKPSAHTITAGSIRGNAITGGSYGPVITTFGGSTSVDGTE